MHGKGNTEGTQFQMRLFVSRVRSHQSTTSTDVDLVFGIVARYGYTIRIANYLCGTHLLLFYTSSVSVLW